MTAVIHATKLNSRQLHNKEGKVLILAPNHRKLIKQALLQQIIIIIITVQSDCYMWACAQHMPSYMYADKNQITTMTTWLFRLLQYANNILNWMVNYVLDLKKKQEIREVRKRECGRERGRKKNKSKTKLQREIEKVRVRWKSVSLSLSSIQQAYLKFIFVVGVVVWELSKFFC